MRNIILLSLLFSLAACSGTSIENSSEPVNNQLNVIGADIAEGSGRNETANAPNAGLAPGQRGVMPQEPPRGGN